MNPQDPKYQHKSKTISSAVSRAKLLCSLCYETPCNAWKFSSLFLSCQHAKIKKLLYSKSESLVSLWMMWFPFLQFTSSSREFMNFYASFSGRNKSLSPAGLSICSLNGFSICVWIFGTILLLWNHSSWPQTSLRNHFGLCCWNGRPLFCHPAFTPYGRCDWKTDYR